MLKNIFLKTFSNGKVFPRLSKMVSSSRASIMNWIGKNKTPIMTAAAAATTSTVINFAINRALNSQTIDTSSDTPNSRKLKMGVTLEKALSDIRFGLGGSSALNNTERQAALIRGLMTLGVVVGEHEDEETASVGLVALKMALPCGAYSILPTTLDSNDVAISIITALGMRDSFDDIALATLTEMAEVGVIRN
jgi:hypothetical protein